MVEMTRVSARKRAANRRRAAVQFSAFSELASCDNAGPMIRLVGVVSLVTLLAASPLARASAEDEARVYLDKATAAYALNKYAVAAEKTEDFHNWRTVIADRELLAMQVVAIIT